LRRAAVAAALALAGLAGCGTPSADLLVIERAGDLPDARVTLVVGDGGTVECDGTEQTLPNDLLLDARDLTDDLEPILARNARLPAPPAAILRYRVTAGGRRALRRRLPAPATRARPPHPLHPRGGHPVLRPGPLRHLTSRRPRGVRLSDAHGRPHERSLVNRARGCDAGRR
jgi:hypothetical protein